MQKENINIFEGNHEYGPSEKEIRSVFEQFEGKTDFNEIRKLKDNDGIYLWEVSFPKEKGDTVYTYIRKGTHDEVRSLVTKISVSRFNRAGIPPENSLAAKLTGGEWEILE